jgi:hypothetical protein
MADWMVLLFKVFIYLAIQAVLLVAVGKWLVGRITKLLDSQNTDYMQQKVPIDARIDHLGKASRRTGTADENLGKHQGRDRCPGKEPE